MHCSIWRIEMIACREILKKLLSISVLVGVIQSPALATEITPDVALARLKAGNKRYVQGKSAQLRIDALRRAETAQNGQKPIATVLGCSDARVPVELIFDQGFADVFVIRVAGNVCGTAELASAEYGCKYLNTPLLVVLGHSSCGAVDGAVSGGQLRGSIPQLIEMIQPAVDKARKEHGKASKEVLLNAAIQENVFNTMSCLLKKGPGLAALVKEGKLKVVGAVRNLHSGEITWLGTHPQQDKFIR
ncbi:MAG: carbonic anhydrase [Candidatus Obscuribacterales bacterium]|nr:carbonic anhydrase [Candidatus Obscuribacterales bacterium]